MDAGLLSSPLHLRAAKLGFALLADLSIEAKTFSPADFIDVTYLKELEQSGFIKNLYGE